jgi:hypothetical protein
MTKIKYFENYMVELTEVIENGTLDEVLAIAKEYDINSTTVRIPSRQYVVIEMLKKRLTLEKYDWTTI